MFKRVARSFAVPAIAFLLSGCSMLLVNGRRKLAQVRQTRRS